jgi:hypothetical protein
MKLKFELVNGFGVLVDEEADPFLLPVGKTVLHVEDSYRGFRKIEKDTILGFLLSGKRIYWEVVFAEKELGLDVPVFEWRDFEVEKLAIKEFPHDTGMSIVARGAFRKGYKSNPAKYTENDLREAIAFGKEQGVYYEFATQSDSSKEYAKGLQQDQQEHIEIFIQSLQKYPAYIVMSMEAINDFGEPYSFDDIDFGVEKEYRLKLYTNSEGKQQGTVKELI